MYKQKLADHIRTLGKFRLRLAGEMPAADRAQLESVVRTYERLYPEPKQEAYGRG
jgi:hypothetical protein